MDRPIIASIADLEKFFAEHTLENGNLDLVWVARAMGTQTRSLRNALRDAEYKGWLWQELIKRRISPIGLIKSGVPYDAFLVILEYYTKHVEFPRFLAKKIAALDGLMECVARAATEQSAKRQHS